MSNNHIGHSPPSPHPPLVFLRDDSLLKSTGIDGTTPLAAAARDQNEFAVKTLLLQFPESVNNQSIYGYNPLIYAARGGNFVILQLLLKAKSINHNLQDHLGRTALIHAVTHKGGQQAECVQALLVAGADINVRDKSGKTAVQLAVDPNIKRMLHQAAQAQPDREEKNNLPSRCACIIL